MIFERGTKLYAYEVRNEAGENVAYVNYLGASFIPSIASLQEVMARNVDLLIESPNISRIILVQQRNYNYNFEQVSMLAEIANLYTFLLKQDKILSPEKLGNLNTAEKYDFLTNFLQGLKFDAFLAYQRIRDKLTEQKSFQLEQQDKSYIRLLDKIIKLLGETKLIKKLIEREESANGRVAYSEIFAPDIIPNFAFARLASALPEGAKIVDQYEIGIEEDKSTITILKKPNELKYFYHLMPPEYFLNEDFQMLLNLARNVLIEHQPKAEEFVDPARTRQVFFNVARDLLQELSQNRKIYVSYTDLNKLSNILVRHTIGFGLLEVLLQDKELQDIVLNAPITLNPIFLRHSKYDECETNILLSQEDADSWAAKFRMISGRPLDEANPILDTQLEIGKMRARIAIIQQPLSPDGLSYAMRRHREEPWTCQLFMQNKMINPLAAGLLSFLVDGARTLLVAGTRSSGKTSLLGSLMLEIIPKFRVIVVEDSLELPVDSMRKLGYDILRMKVRSALLKTGTEVSADDGIRTSLRLGDSCLIIGEVRSVEAKALYEAMRVGALANVVAGTIHGASPYGVFDRVVNYLEVPVTSFKATDAIVVCNPVKTPDGLHSWRRVLQISEVRKHWREDPLEEKGFVDLMTYNVEKDELEPSDDLINGDSEIIKNIASNVKGWAGNWDAIYDNILLRAKIKKETVDMAIKTGKEKILEADFAALSNHMFHKISDEIRQETGLPLSERVFPEWQKWLNKEVKKRKF